MGFVYVELNARESQPHLNPSWNLLFIILSKNLPIIHCELAQKLWIVLLYENGGICNCIIPLPLTLCAGVV